MLDNGTKRRIDTARDVLVGKVPDPKSQVEQITIALIYKFMDDMDKESVAMGGKPSFFVGEYEKYSWSKIFDPRLGGFEMLALYADAITRMSMNPNLPQLFRDIFKNAYLPYRDPETLKLFLKTINEFNYDHSERLGDAFEYLLSVLGSQGEAGQFRTPRHIIDFIVSVIQPKKNETILDPACGTAGFLISSYKHIIKDNTKKTPGDLLTPDERKKLLTNFKGYDISPDMVRLSLVNLYLHGFVQPQIVEYDTLTSEDRWNEYADVILANPPFMSPKGGIKPHKRFSVQSNRSEVLFVDYIAEHLRPTGRAGIIVPEGIIFQSANAYKQLRKYLVDNECLWAVVSLPAGVFNPYSGVKTSILLMDKVIAKKTDKILFVKVDNDGFDLGAQRRPNGKNDLPDATNVLVDWLKAVRNGKTKDFNVEEKPCGALLVEKIKLAETDDFNLSGDRYRVGTDYTNAKWPMVELGNMVADKKFAIVDGPFGTQLHSDEYVDKGIPVVRVSNLDYDAKFSTKDLVFISEKKYKDLERSSVLPGDVIVAKTGATIGKLGIFPAQYDKGIVASSCIKLSLNATRALPEFVAYLLSSSEGQNQILSFAAGATRNTINIQPFSKIKIPLPPLEIQQQIVAEIEGYQKIIDGARQVVESWKPQIEIDPEWPMVKLGEVCENLDSQRRPVEKSERKPGPYPYYGASGIVDYVDNFIFNGDFLLVSEDGANLRARVTPIAFSISGKNWVNNHAHILKFSSMDTQKYAELYLNQIKLEFYITGMAQPKLNQASMNDIPIPFPHLEVQREIVARSKPSAK